MAYTLRHECDVSHIAVLIGGYYGKPPSDFADDKLGETKKRLRCEVCDADHPSSVTLFEYEAPTMQKRAKDLQTPWFGSETGIAARTGSRQVTSSTNQPLQNTAGQ